MKILYLTEFFPEQENQIKGGVEARSYFLIKELNKKHKFYILSSSGVHLHGGGLKQRLIYLFSSIKKSYKLRKEIDLIEASGWLGYLAALIVKIFIKKPTLITYHEVWIGQWKKLFGWLGIIGYLCEKIILKQNWTKIITVSQQTKKQLIDQGISENKIEVIYNGVNLDEINKINVEPQSDFLICTVSRLVKYKNISLLIRAIKEIPEVKLLIIGTGPEENNLKLEVKNLQLESRVKLLGHLESYQDVLKNMKKTSLFCLPSEKEGFGIVTIEAAACGTPYVISDIAVHQEITKQGRGGLLFKSGNLNDLIDKIKLLKNNLSLYQEKKKEVLNLAQNYSWELLAQKVNDIYFKYGDKKL